MTDLTTEQLDEIERLDDKPACSKPGCGARAILARPCFDHDCPQRFLSHTDAKVLAQRDGALIAMARGKAGAEVERDTARGCLDGARRTVVALQADWEAEKTETARLREQVAMLREERDTALYELSKMSGRVLEAVRESFRLCNHQTTASLIASVSAASPKQVNNALGYLTRHDEIERLGYGQYRAKSIRANRTEINPDILAATSPDPAPGAVKPDRFAAGSLTSDETAWVLPKARKILGDGVNIQALGDVTNQTIEGLVRALVAHCDELDADLKCAIAVGRYAAAIPARAATAAEPREDGR